MRQGLDWLCEGVKGHYKALAAKLGKEKSSQRRMKVHSMENQGRKLGGEFRRMGTVDGRLLKKLTGKKTTWKRNLEKRVTGTGTPKADRG